MAQRLALSGRAVAYGEKNIVYQGPFPSMYTLTENKLTIEYDSGNSLIEVRSAEGFEVRLVSLCLAFRISNYRYFFSRQWPFLHFKHINRWPFCHKECGPAEVRPTTPGLPVVNRIERHLPCMIQRVNRSSTHYMQTLCWDSRE